MREKLGSFCYSLSEDEYWGLLKTITANWQGRIRRDLTALSCLELLQKNCFCFALPGSDGKRERHPQSKTELILLLERKDPLLMERAKREVGEIKREGLGSLEVKIVGKEGGPLSFYDNQPQHVYPDRVLNSCFLMGDYDLYVEARRQVLEEMKERKVKKKMKDQLRQHKKAIETGFYRGRVVFSEKEGRQYYFESPDPKELRFGFKISFLRAVQRKLDLLTSNLAENENDLGLLAESLPSNTVERISFFAKRGLIPEDFASRLQKAYLWFLENYHCAQEAFLRSGRRQVVAVPFDKDRFLIEKETVMAFCCNF